jgi:hypothetical protein
MQKKLYIKFLHFSLLFSIFCLVNIHTDIELIFISNADAETTMRDTDLAESECERIGYKPKTEKYAECVIELYSRTKKRNVIIEIPKNLSQEGKQCIEIGYVYNSAEFSNCQIQLRQLASQEQHYREQQASYNQQLQLQQKQQNLYEAEILLGIANSAFNYGANTRPNPVIINQPPRTLSPPSPLRLRLPSGNNVNCSYVGATYTCR